ncbi:hypothetical protein LEP1GSC058_1305 [Leptospira fainei serovar Hurstbridge str. BUT 6]|uniref:Uncharacterized protein n=1 Tax=Leptospira fainei serovar Hurstbridge str. BUT 6 TaxID=1193011 RepID=S3V4I6_9LEPT|nr:hypothetical protein [Leptospira fainei]EPG76358.1 hypothetical protein LEP1GSC058_1305 [Leptospira fainei serovar Hurstbridge str. BUT 6]
MQEGLLNPKKYLFGALLVSLVFLILFQFGPDLNFGFWKGVASSLLLSFFSYSIRFYILLKNSTGALNAQLGTNVLFFFIQIACLFTFLWMGEREGFIIGFFIAHFANILILVFAR